MENNKEVAVKLEKVLIGGDLSVLNEEERIVYYKKVCESLGLNELTKPFEYITLNGKLTLYAKRDCAEQLRTIHGVSIVNVETTSAGGLYIVKVTAQNKQGRTDVATGVVDLGTLSGEHLANAFMKAETKAKRRVTLSICGLGLLDETEVEDTPQAATGEPVKRIDEVVKFQSDIEAEEKEKAKQEAFAKQKKIQQAIEAGEAWGYSVNGEVPADDKRLVWEELQKHDNYADRVKKVVYTLERISELEKYCVHTPMSQQLEAVEV